MKRLIEIEGDRDVFVHTQTCSYKAINIYKNAGFIITDEKDLLDMKITNMKKLWNCFKTIQNSILNVMRFKDGVK